MGMLMLAVFLPPALMLCRRIATAPPDRAEQLYQCGAYGLALVIYGSMAVQEGVLFLSCQLTWDTALPLHLCSLMGALSLPMLLTRHPLLLNASLFAGVPGALLALIFPAVLETRFPRVTEAAFFALHAALVCAPLLPMAAGWRPRPSGAAMAFLLLLMAGAAAQLANDLTGSNYLFLAGPVDGTPLMWLSRWGLPVYRLLLALLAGLVLAAEALVLRCVRRRQCPLC